jgi:hypothetical protein
MSQKQRAQTIRNYEKHSKRGENLEKTREKTVLHKAHRAAGR